MAKRVIGSVILANMIVLMAEDTAPYFGRALTKASTVSAAEILPQIELELSVLYLHLFDRDVFLEQGEEARNLFADSLFDALSEKIEERIGLDSDAFAAFCNKRQIEYSGYKELLAPPSASLAGTLFWEFGKRMGLEYQGYNPIALQLFTIAATQGYISLREASMKLTRGR